jgi:hypothetical protein
MRATCTELYTHIDWNCRLIKTWANAHIEDGVVIKKFSKKFGGGNPMEVVKTLWEACLPPVDNRGDLQWSTNDFVRRSQCKASPGEVLVPIHGQAHMGGHHGLHGLTRALLPRGHGPHSTCEATRRLHKLLRHGGTTGRTFFRWFNATGYATMGTNATRVPTPQGLRASDYCHGSTTSWGHQRHGVQGQRLLPWEHNQSREDFSSPEHLGDHHGIHGLRRPHLQSSSHRYSSGANRWFSIAILEWKIASSNEDKTPDTYVYSAAAAAAGSCMIWASDYAWQRRSATWM